MSYNDNDIIEILQNNGKNDDTRGYFGLDELSAGTNPQDGGVGDGGNNAINNSMTKANGFDGTKSGPGFGTGSSTGVGAGVGAGTGTGSGIGDWTTANNALVPTMGPGAPPPPLSDSVLPHVNFDGASHDSQYPQKKKKDPPGPKTRPAFVMKIWSMVNDDTNNDYIRWEDDGKTFQVYHREEFMKNILPKYFKHNNFASFVRQLNMYGWHKVQDIGSGTLKDEKSGDESWKFENPYFQKDREDLLDNIVRNKSMSQDHEVMDNRMNVKLVLNELELIKLNQLAITEDLRRIRSDNKTLWHENLVTRERHQKQTQTLDKILKFLATVYGNTNTGKILEVENEGDLNLGSNESPGVNSSTSSPRPRPQLMLMDQAYQGANSSDSGTPRGNNDINVNYGQSPSLSDINKGVVDSPRGYFPELSIPNTPNNDVINGLEQNIYRQGQSIQQVQNWIQKLSNQQQVQQQQLDNQNVDNDRKRKHETGQISEINDDINLSPGALDFDVNEFLHLSYDEPNKKRK